MPKFKKVKEAEKLFIVQSCKTIHSLEDYGLENAVYEVVVKDHFKEVLLYLGRAPEIGENLSLEEFTNGLSDFSRFDFYHLGSFLNRFGKFVKVEAQIGKEDLGMLTPAHKEWKYELKDSLPLRTKSYLGSISALLHRTINIDFNYTPPRLHLALNDHNSEIIFRLGVEVERLKWAIEYEQFAYAKIQHNTKNKKNLPLLNRKRTKNKDLRIERTKEFLDKTHPNWKQTNANSIAEYMLNTVTDHNLNLSKKTFNSYAVTLLDK